MRMHEQSFSIDFNSHKLAGDIIGTGRQEVMFLHGAGTADRSRFAELRKQIAQEGVTSIAFDFIGHGQTGGDLKKTSLFERTEQVLKVLKDLQITWPITLVSASMSGYTSVKVAEMADVKAMILLAPAMYTEQAYSVPFGDGFSEIIREPNSWQMSDAWEILKSYTGGLVIYQAELDHVVPRELIDKIHSSAEKANPLELVVIKDGTHPLGKFLQEHPDESENVAQKIIQLNSGLRSEI